MRARELRWGGALSPSFRWRDAWGGAEGGEGMLSPAAPRALRRGQGEAISLRVRGPSLGQGSPIPRPRSRGAGSQPALARGRLALQDSGGLGREGEGGGRGHGACRICHPV